jgi:hypothetical protein
MESEILSDVTSNVTMSEYLRALLKDVVPSNPNLNGINIFSKLDKTTGYCLQLEIETKYFDLAH